MRAASPRSSGPGRIKRQLTFVLPLPFRHAKRGYVRRDNMEAPRRCFLAFSTQVELPPQDGVRVFTDRHRETCGVAPVCKVLQVALSGLPGARKPAGPTTCRHPRLKRGLRTARRGWRLQTPASRSEYQHATRSIWFSGVN